jgi:hypothetical protein
MEDEKREEALRFVDAGGAETHPWLFHSKQ